MEDGGNIMGHWCMVAVTAASINFMADSTVK